MRSRTRNSVPFSLFAFQDIITSVTGIMIFLTMMLALEMLQKKQSSPEIATPAIADRIADAVADNEREIQQHQQALNEGVAALRIDADVIRRRLDEMRRAREELERQNAALAADLKAAQTRQGEVEREAQHVSPERWQQLREEAAALQQRLQRLRAANRVLFNRTQGEPKTPWLVEINRANILAAETGKSMRPKSFAAPDDLLAWAKTQNPGSIYFVLLVKPDSAARFAPLREGLLRGGFEIGYDLLTAEQQAIDLETGAGSG